MHSRRTQFIASFACIAVIALICAVLLPSAQHSSARVDGDPSAPPAQAPATNDAAAQLKAAVDGIGNDAGYRFNATIEQALTPRAVSGMLGQQTQHVTLWLDGEREPAESRFSVRVNGASGGQAARFVARNGQLFKQTDDTLEPVQGGADSAMLPATRMADFLRAAEGVTRLADEKHAGGISARYAFALNMRVLSERLGGGGAGRAALVDALTRMSGSGEVWVDAATGAVQRQIVTLNIPGASSLYDAQVKASIDLRDWTGVTFTPIDGAAAAQTPPTVAAHPNQTGKTWTNELSAWISRAAQPAALLAACVLIAVCMVLAYRKHPRRAQRALTKGIVAVLLLSTPLGVAGKAFAAAQEAQRPSFAQAIGLSAPAGDNSSAAQTAAQTAPLLKRLQSAQFAAPDAAACGAGQPGVDTDRDGLTDQQEACLGTDPLNEDTDGDLLSDGMEVRGFTFNTRTITLNPFEPDSNRDGLSDSQELTATLDALSVRPAGATEYDIDGDGTPNVLDVDNDGDGVPDDADISPNETGAYAPDMTIQVSGGGGAGAGAGEYRYIEGQVQPESATERVFGASPLDWPDGDSLGQVNDLNNSKDDLRLTPFLRIETRNVPSALRDEYGVALLEPGSAITDSVMLIPLNPVKDGGLVKSFYFKAAYAPSESLNGIRWKARIVWMLRAEFDSWEENCRSGPQTTCVSSRTQVLHSYDGGAFRLTGLNVVKSAGYEMAVLGTPNTPNEDANLFQALYGFGHLFLNFATLQDQPATRSALAELADRFRPGAVAMPTNLRLNLPITVPVAVSRMTFAHHDEAIAGANLQLIPSFLSANYGSATDAQKCVDSTGALFQCATLGLAYEEKLGSSAWATSRAGNAYSVNLADVPLITNRGVRGAMFERTATGWQMMDSPRMMATVENRYQRQLAAVLGRMRQLDPNATERDVRMGSYLPYLEWFPGKNTISAVDGAPMLTQNASDEGALLTQAVPIQVDTNRVTLAEQMFVLSPLWTTEAGGYSLAIAGFIAFKAAYAYHRELSSKISSFLNNRWKVAGKLLQAGTVAVAIAEAVCAKNKGSCDEQALSVSKQVFAWLTVAGEMAEARAALISMRTVRAEASAAQGAASGAKAASTAKALSKGGAALVIAGAALDITMAWVEYSILTKNMASDDDIGHKRALSMAIGLTIWAVIVVAINFIPVVGPLISAILSLIDVILIAATGGKWTLGRAMVELFYSVNVLTDIKQSGFEGGGTSLSDESRGFVSGNRFRIADRYQGISVPTSDGGKGDLNDAVLRGFYAIAGGERLTAPAATIEGPSRCYYIYTSGWEWHCANDMQVEYQLPAVATRDYPVSFYMKSRIGIVYEECGLFGSVCGSNKVDYRTLPEDKDLGDPVTLYLDVLPATAAQLWDPAQNGNLIGNPDLDGDGLSNTQETALGTNPRNPDTDGDGLADGFEAAQSGRNASSPLRADSDSDGVGDYDEYRMGLSSASPDIDADGLRDGDELAGWLVNLPGSLSVRVFSDATLANTDGDALTDAQERATAQSPFGINAGPLMAVDVAPFAVSPDGSRLGAFVRPSQAVTTAFALVNPGPVAIANNDALSVCLPLPISGAGAVRLTGDRAPLFSTSACANGQQANWRFDGANTLQPFEAVSGTIDSAIAGGGASTSMNVSVSVPYDGRVYSSTARVIVDAEAPTVRLTAPEDGAILRRDPSGTVFNIGGVSGDESSWVSRVTLSVNNAQAAAFDNPAGEFVHGWQLPATDGQYTLAATATDYLGASSTSAPVNVIVDGTAPTAAVDLGQFTTINGRSFVRSERGGVIVLNGSASDATAGLATVQVSIDGRPFKEVIGVRDPITAPAVTARAWSLTWTLPITDSAPDGDYPAQGAHSIVLRAMDRAGNIRDVAPVTIVVDIAPPSSDLTTNAYVFTPTVQAGVPISLTGRANDLGNLPLPSRATRLQGNLNSVYSATLWMQLENQSDSAGLTMTWLGDVNGDGRNDFAVGTPASNAGAGRVSIVYGRAGDYRVPPDSEAIFNTPSALSGAPGAGLGSLVSAVGDVNGDGLYDLAVGDAASQRVFVVFGRVTPLGAGGVLSDGVSGAQTLIDVSGLGALRDVRSAGDVNRDGNDDLLVATANAVYLLLGQSGVWQPALALDTQAAAIRTVSNASAAGLGDVDGDGYADFGIGASNNLTVLRGGTGFAPRARSAIALNGAGVLATFSSADAAPRAIALGDFNGDGKADFALSNASAPALILGAATPVRYAGALPTANGFIAAPGDVNGDGLADLLLGNAASQSAVLLVGSRAVTSASSAPIVAQATFANVTDAASAPYATGGDLNCDQASDVLLLPSSAPAITHAQTSAYGRVSADTPQIAAFDVARLPSVGTAYSATLPAAASNVLYVGCAGCYSSIQAALTAATANTRIVVLPGVYDPFVISGVAKNGVSIEGAGAGPDQVIIDAAGAFSAAEIRDVRGVTLNRIALRNARVGVRVTNAGYAGLGGATVATSTIRLDGVLVHDVLSSTLDLDRLSFVDTRNSTLLETASRPLVNVDAAPDPAYIPAWTSRFTNTLGAAGSMVGINDGSAQPPVYALTGNRGLQSYNAGIDFWVTRASVPNTITTQSSNLASNANGSQLYVLPNNTWNGLGGGVNGTIRAMVRAGDCLVVAGSFNTMFNPDGSSVSSNSNYGLGCWNLTNNQWQAITLVANGASTIYALAVAGSPQKLLVGGQLKFNNAAYGLETCTVSGSAFSCVRQGASADSIAPEAFTDVRYIDVYPQVATPRVILFGPFSAFGGGCPGTGAGLYLDSQTVFAVSNCVSMNNKLGDHTGFNRAWVSDYATGYVGDKLLGCFAYIPSANCGSPPVIVRGADRGGAAASINGVMMIDEYNAIAVGDFTRVRAPVKLPDDTIAIGDLAADGFFQCTVGYSGGVGSLTHYCFTITLPGTAGTAVTALSRGSGTGSIYAARGNLILKRLGDYSWQQVAAISAGTITSIDDIVVNGITQLIVGGTFAGGDAVPASSNVLAKYRTFSTYTVATNIWSTVPFPDTYTYYDSFNENWVSAALPSSFNNKTVLSHNGSGFDIIAEGDSALYQYTAGGASLSVGPALPVGAGIGTAALRIGGDLYVAIGQSAQLYRLRSGTWTRLNDAPFTFGSGASLAYDGIGSIYAAQGGGGAQYARYRLSNGQWGAAQSVSISNFRIDSGGGLAQAGNRIYAVRGNSQPGFAMLGAFQAPPVKLALSSNALLAPRGSPTATLHTLTAQEDDYAVTLSGNQFVDGGTGATTWTPSASAITRASLKLVDEDADVYRTTAGSALTTGYYARRDATHATVAYVAPTYCATCANDGHTWGIDAFASIQLAINSGAQRVLLAPGVYAEAFQLANGTQVIGAGAEKTIIRPPAGWTGALVSADGVSQASLSRVTLDGQSRAIVGFRSGGASGGGARDVRLARAIVRNMSTAIVLNGPNTQTATDVEISNVTLVQNNRAIDQSGNALLDLRNSIVALNSDGIRATAATPRLEYNLYFKNGAAFGSDVNGGAPSGPGEITQDPLFVNSAAADFRLLPESPAIDAGNPGDPTPPSIGGRVDLGYVESAQAAFFADNDYGQNALNDGLTWQIDAFATISEATSAAERYLGGLSCASEQLASEARGICNTRVIVGVGPGTYTESVRVPSYVRLIGAGAESVLVNANGASAPLRIDGAIRAEVSGLTLIGGATAGVDVTNASNGVLIERNIIRANGAGVRVSGGAEARIRFNTVLSNTTGVEVTGSNAFADAENNILAYNNSGFSVATSDARARSSHNLINSKLLNYGAAPDRVQSKDEDLVATAPGFVNEAAGNYRLTAASAAVDSAAGADTPPLGGGAIADRGYAELTAIPLTVFLGQSTAPMCIAGNAGVAAVEIGLRGVAQASQALTETLPTSWQRLTFGTPLTATYWSASVTPAAGPQRLYSRGEDALGNVETPLTRYTDNFGRRLDQPKLNIYDGALIGDGSAPTLALLAPTANTTTSAAVLTLRATATGTLSGAFDVAEPFFEVDGNRYAAVWVDAIGTGAREFRSKAALPLGVHTVRAGATDKAGNIGYSGLVNVTIGASGGPGLRGAQVRGAGASTPHVLDIVAPVDGAWTNQSTLRINGAVRFSSAQGAGVVRVQSGANAPVDAALSDRFAVLSNWTADVALVEGGNTLTATASNDDAAATAQASFTLNRDTVLPTLTTPPNGAVATRTVEISGTVADAASGVAAVDVSVDGGLTWLPATIAAGRYTLIWEAPLAEQNTSYPIKVRATDVAGNIRTQDLSVVVDNTPPGGVDPVSFNIPVDSHLDVTSSLVMSWTPATDNSGAVTVTAAINQVTATLPGAVQSGTTLTGSMNADGAWYAHVSAVDRAGNQLNRVFGPWHIGLGNLCYATQSIALDGVIGVDNNEWRPVEFMDDDERSLVSSLAGARRERQSLYVTWDADAFYVGWRGAWWDIDGAMVAYLDTDGAAGGGTQPVLAITPTVALPFSADWAVVVDGLNSGTLYHFESGAWVSRGPAQFGHSTQGDTEIRIETPIRGLGTVRALAYATTGDSTVWSVFPTTNPLNGPWTDAYVWGQGGSICDNNQPGDAQPRATSLNVTLESAQATDVARGAGATLDYTIRVENLEAFTVPAASLVLSATNGLAYRSATLPVGASCADCVTDAAGWRITLPVLAPGTSVSLSVSGRLAVVLAGVNAVTTTVGAQPAALAGELSLSHRVDSIAPTVAPAPAPAGAVRPGPRTLVGSASDDGGSGLQAVEIRRVGDLTWSPVTGTLTWSADVALTAGEDAQFALRARDVAGNLSDETIVQLRVDATAPEVTFTAPALIGGAANSNLVIDGTAQDTQPTDSVVADVQLQVVDPADPAGESNTPWIDAFGPYSATVANGEQPWHAAWTLPEADGAQRRIRASATDAAGNVTISEWQTATIDTVAPEIVAQQPYTLTTADFSGVLLSGTITDGVQVVSSTLLIYAPNGESYTETLALKNGAWAWAAQQQLITGTYKLRVQAGDSAGNTRIVGPLTLIVNDAPADGIRIDASSDPATLFAPVTFTVSASGTNLSYAWDFGDGAIGAGAQVTHAFGAIGAYTVAVTATNSAGDVTATRGIVIVDIPASGLHIVNDSPTRLGDATAMTASVSAGSNVLFDWDFGDGATGAGDAITHTYAAGGVYTVTVGARNGTSTITQAMSVDIRDFAVITLSAENDGPTVLGGMTTLSATQDGGTGVSYVWDFGDGAAGQGITATHVYSAAGDYTATVTSRNTEGERSASTVVVVDEPVSGLVINTDAPTALGDTTLFSTSAQSGSRLRFEWSFGDGATSAAAEPVHHYAAIGYYTVIVTASNSLSVMTATQTVRVHDVSIHRLAAANSSPHTVAYTTHLTASIAAGTGVSYTWDFGDGESGAGATLAHVYAAPGEYTATVTASNDSGSISDTTRVTIWPVPQIGFAPTTVDVNEAQGAAVVTVTLDTPSSAPVSVRYATQNGDADATDYVAASGQLIFAPGERGKTITITLVNDGDYETAEAFGVTLSDATNATLSTPASMTVRIADDDPRIRRTFLPLAMRTYSAARGPDLIVRSAELGANGIVIVIENAGSEPVQNAFWVDLYVAPKPPPAKVNDVWSDGRSVYGAAWGVTSGALPLQPGARLTLTLSSPYYQAGKSKLGVIAAGTPFAVQVDSASTTDPVYGAVRESHELAKAAYNNIHTGTVASAYAPATVSVQTAIGPADDSDELPGRAQ